MGLTFPANCFLQEKLRSWWLRTPTARHYGEQGRRAMALELSPSRIRGQCDGTRAHRYSQAALWQAYSIGEPPAMSAPSDESR
jgi:hypothetical protein